MEPPASRAGASTTAVGGGRIQIVDSLGSTRAARPYARVKVLEIVIAALEDALPSVGQEPIQTEAALKTRRSPAV
jgi:hypothetical protein